MCSRISNCNLSKGNQIFLGMIRVLSSLFTKVWTYCKTAYFFAEKGCYFTLFRSMSKSIRIVESTFTKIPLLQYSDISRIFNLTYDVSNLAFGCIMSQSPIGKNPSIAYASRVLNKTEKKNTTQLKKCYVP